MTSRMTARTNLAVFCMASSALKLAILSDVLGFVLCSSFERKLINRWADELAKMVVRLLCIMMSVYVGLMRFGVYFRDAYSDKRGRAIWDSMC